MAKKKNVDKATSEPEVKEEKKITAKDVVDKIRAKHQKYHHKK